MLQIQQCTFWNRLVDECGGHSRLSTPPRPTYPMHVIFNLSRHVEINDMLNVREIQALCCDVSGNQNILLPNFELLDCLVSIHLILPTVNGNSIDSFEKKVFVYVIDILLFLAKNANRRRRLLQTLQQIHNFSLLLHIFNLLNDVQVGSTGPSNVNQDRLDQNIFGKVLELFGHCGAEEQSLSLLFEVVHDAFDFFIKTKVKHSVPFVQANIPADSQIYFATVQQIRQSSRCGYNTMDAMLQHRHKLRSLIFSTNAQKRP
mmetsp:Transcript_14242/g.21071  ORF Transcript_14242/g.21071 Transcript_14242/m.21071 type:complete len:260 (-) Transcript_14242:832-1611(-)